MEPGDKAITKPDALCKCLQTKWRGAIVLYSTTVESHAVIQTGKGPEVVQVAEIFRQPNACKHMAGCGLDSYQVQINHLLTVQITEILLYTFMIAHKLYIILNQYLIVYFLQRYINS